MKPGRTDDPRFLGGAVACGLTGDGREVVVYPRMYNAIIAIGRQGGVFIDDQW